MPGNNATVVSDLTIAKIVDVYDGERAHFSNCYRSRSLRRKLAWTVEAMRAIKRSDQPLKRDVDLSEIASDPTKRELESRLLEKI